MKPIKEKMNAYPQDLIDLEPRVYWHQYLSVALFAHRTQKPGTTNLFFDDNSNPDNPRITSMNAVFEVVMQNDEARLLQIDKELENLIIANTNDKNYYHPLPFDTIFINNNFHLNERFILKGLAISDYGHAIANLRPIIREASDDDIIKLYQSGNKDFKIDALQINYICLDIEDTSEFFGIIHIPHTEERERYRPIYKNEKDREAALFIEDNLPHILFNVLDLMDSDDIYHVNASYTREHKLKRLEKGKCPINNTIFIKAKPKLSDYAKKFNIGIKNRFSHQFMVRGHWRRYISDKYTYMKGKANWILPFWKGKGIKIKKDYMLKRNENLQESNSFIKEGDGKNE